MTKTFNNRARGTKTTATVNVDGTISLAVQPIRGGTVSRVTVSQAVIGKVAGMLATGKPAR